MTHLPAADRDSQIKEKNETLMINFKHRSMIEKNIPRKKYGAGCVIRGNYSFVDSPR